MEAHKIIVQKLQDQIMEYTEPMEDIKEPPVKIHQIESKPVPIEDIKATEPNMDNNLVEICYVPSRNNIHLDENDEVAIVSEFTNWKQDRLICELRDGENVYFGKYPLQGGFKYKFRFTVNGNPVNDIGYPDTKNTLGQSYNYIVVHGDLGIPWLKHKRYLDPSFTSHTRQEGMQKYFGPIEFTIV